MKALRLASCIAVALCSKASSAQVVMLSPDAPGGTPEITGGRPAIPQEWKASFRFEFNGKVCSATVIGARTILTAAHCVDGIVSGQLKAETFSTKISLCRAHSRYSADYTYDVAMCLAEKAIQLGGSAGYERINIDPKIPQPGSVLTLQGYGCRQGDGLGPTGVLWLGEAVVKASASGEQYIVTSGGAAVCSGDSGGAAFLDIDKYRRIIVGVNSRGLINTFSYITDIARSSIHDDFISEWSKKVGTICGISEPAANCHD